MLKTAAVSRKGREGRKAELNFTRNPQWKRGLKVVGGQRSRRLRRFNVRSFWCLRTRFEDGG